MRAFFVSVAYKAGVSDTDIRMRTQHRSEKGLETYQHSSSAHNLSVHNVLSNAVGKGVESSPSGLNPSKNNNAPSKLVSPSNTVQIDGKSLVGVANNVSKSQSPLVAEGVLKWLILMSVANHLVIPVLIESIRGILCLMSKSIARPLFPCVVQVRN